ncbi:hypothetical protein COOONC_00407 [Cooperia oncophora]
MTIFLLIYVTPWASGPVIVVICVNIAITHAIAKLIVWFYVLGIVSKPVSVLSLLISRPQDMDAIDTTLPGSIRSMLMTVFNVIATLVVIVIATPLVAIPFVFLAAFYIVVLVRTDTPTGPDFLHEAPT